jgi:hypothetical protein
LERYADLNNRILETIGFSRRAGGEASSTGTFQIPARQSWGSIREKLEKIEQDKAEEQWRAKIAATEKELLGDPDGRPD